MTAAAWTVRGAAFLIALTGVRFAAAVAADPPLPEAVAAPGAAVVMAAHGVGAQIYECKADASGKLDWQFREPIATLVADGRTVGRHFAGPSWELADGSVVVGKVVGRADGATGEDIPWLKLQASGGRGKLAEVTVIQRINTKGGALAGGCEKPGELIAVRYAADYVFLGKGG